MTQMREPQLDTYAYIDRHPGASLGTLGRTITNPQRELLLTLTEATTNDALRLALLSF